MAKLFGRNGIVISCRIHNVFEEDEIEKKSNVQNMHITNSEVHNDFDALLPSGPFSKSAESLGKTTFFGLVVNPMINVLKYHENIYSLVFNVKLPILGLNRTRQGYARKRILKLAGHFF